MAREVDPDYFSKPPFAAKGGLSFAAYTCNGCSQRLKTWAHFKEHRKTCTGELWRRGAKPPGGYTEPRKGSAPLSEEDMGALAELLRRVEEGAASGVGTPATRRTSITRSVVQQTATAMNT